MAMSESGLPTDPSQKRTVLILDQLDDLGEAKLGDGTPLQQELAHTYQLIRTLWGSGAMECLSRSDHPIEAVLLRWPARLEAGLQSLRQLQQHFDTPCPPVIVIGPDQIEIAIEVLKSGAADYLIQDRLSAEQLRQSVQTALTQAEHQQVARDRLTSERHQAITALKQHPDPSQQLIDSAPIGIGLGSATGEERLRQILDSLFIFVGVLTPAGVLIEVNQATLAATSLQPKDVLGKPLDQVYWWSYRLDIQAQLREGIRQAAAGQTIRYDVSIRLSPETFITIDFALVPIIDEHGQVELIVPSGIDISDRLQTQRSLQESQSQLQHRLAELETIYHSAPIGLGVLDHELRFVQINQHLADINGLAVEAHIGRTVRELLPDLADNAEPLLRQVLDTGTPSYEIEVRGETPAQPGVERIWIEQWSPIIAEGTVVGINLVCEEITARRRADLELREAHVQLEAALAAGAIYPFNWYILDNCVIADRNFAQLLGFDPEEALAGLPIERFFATIHPEDQPRVVAAVEQAVVTGTGFAEEYRICHLDGTERWVIARGKADSDHAGNATYFPGVLADITDRRRTELRLKHSTELFEQASLAANSLIYEWDLHTHVVRRLRGLEALTGYTSEEEEDTVQWWADLIHPEDRARLDMNAFFDYIAIHGCYCSEYRVRHKNGHYIWVEDNLIVSRDLQGRPSRVVGSSRDISGRKQIEAALRRSEEQLRVAIESAQLGIWDWDLVEDKLKWDDRSRSLFGIGSDADATIETFYKALHPNDRDRVQHLVQRALDPTTGGTCEVECRVIGIEDGIERWIAARWQVYFDDLGHPQRLIGTVLDITKRKQAEATLAENESRLRSFVDSNVVGILYGDIDGRIYQANDELLRIIGHSRAELEEGGLCWDTIAPSEYLPLDAEHIAEAQERGACTPYEKEFMRPDGSRIPILLAYSLLGEARQESVAFILDISERKQAAIEREKLLEREQAARESAERANRVKDEFLAILSHELRTPLSPILGWSQLMQIRKLTPEQTQRALTTIERNAQLQIQLIDDLLDVGRILRGKLKLESEIVNPIIVIESAIETVQNAAQAKSIQIQTHLVEIGFVWGDSGRIQQILWNLLSNAIKFTPSGGRVQVRLEQVEDQAQIRVTDTGKGISPDFLPYLFDSFRQQDHSISRRYGGLGLGLSIVRYLVEAHGGTVTASSPGEGQGATFTVQFPLLSQDPVPGARGIQTQPDIDMSGIRVLAVDDSVDARELLTTILQQFGAEVLAVATGSNLLANLSTFQPDILLCDLGMPEMDGYALIEQIRSLPAELGGQVAAIALTAYTREEDKEQALRCGYQAHVAKPIEIDELIQTICSLSSNYKPK